MNKIFTLLAVSLVFTISAQQQLTPPQSWHTPSLEDISLNIEHIGTFDHATLLDEDVVLSAETGREFYGRILFENFSPETSGTWTELADGSKIWQLKIKSENALAVCAFFDDYHVPDGASLWIWSADKSFFEGPYTSEHNNDHGRMGTDEVYGDEAVIEYYQPADVVGEFSLTTYGFGHFYNHIHDYRDEWQRGGSQSCEVDVNCPEGFGWEGHRDAVTRMRITDGQFIFLCTGVMVNNAARNCDQIMLTAFHCTEGVSDADLLLMQVRFNYERAGCASGAIVTTHSRTGVLELAHSNDGGGNNGSDFACYMVEDEISDTWPVFYAGWDASGAGSSSGVSIHHPSGDIKKVSTYSSALVSSNWGFANNSHWRVNWVATETNHGVTEGGSSGSPIFNADGQIIGTLTGGSSCCEGKEDPNSGCVGENAPDWYGKFSYHWDGNNNPTADLKDVLDPTNSGVEELFGAYAPNCNEAWVTVPELEWNNVGVFPNPTTSSVTFNLEGKFQLATIGVYNAMGQQIDLIRPAYNTGEIDLDGFQSGIYYLTFTTESNQQVTKKVTKI
ncbi:MAG: T9SS type A sorting domain-containing protein [Flavobacteriales bacterium]|nr:T9SS type A sorting domain-containing protein [Flavobacteriales bacterium]